MNVVKDILCDINYIDPKHIDTHYIYIYAAHDFCFIVVPCVLSALTLAPRRLCWFIQHALRISTFYICSKLLTK